MTGYTERIFIPVQNKNTEEGRVVVNETKIIFLPGEVTISAFDAMKKALMKLGRVPIKKPAYNKELLGQVFRKMNPKQNVVKYRPRAKSLVVHENFDEKRQRIRREIREAGATVYGAMKSESRYLPKLIHDGEHVEALIYGQHGPNSVMLVATNERIMMLDKKIMLVKFDEVSYEVVSGVGLQVGLLFAKVVLHTPIANYDISFVNLHCADRFAKHIELHRLKKEAEESEKHEIHVIEHPLLAPDKTEIPPRVFPNEPEDDLAGTYFLPIDEEERDVILHEIP